MEFYDEAEMNMMSAIENLEKRLVTVRAGRANPAMQSHLVQQQSLILFRHLQQTVDIS